MDTALRRAQEEGRGQERLRRQNSDHPYGERYGGTIPTGGEHEAGARRAMPGHLAVIRDPNATATGEVDERKCQQDQVYRNNHQPAMAYVRTYRIGHSNAVAAWDNKMTKGERKEVILDFNVFKGQMEALFMQEECDDALRTPRPIMVGDPNVKTVDLVGIFGVPAAERAQRAWTIIIENITVPSLVEQLIATTSSSTISNNHRRSPTSSRSSSNNNRRRSSRNSRRSSSRRNTIDSSSRSNSSNLAPSTMPRPFPTQPRPDQLPQRPFTCAWHVQCHEASPVLLLFRGFSGWVVLLCSIRML